MSVIFQEFNKIQTNTIERDQMNHYEDLINIKTEGINNILTQSNNEYLIPQVSKTNKFENDKNKNIHISNSDKIAPHIQDKKNDFYNITKGLLSKYRLVLIILAICIVIILVNIITILALKTGNKELESKLSTV
jgi:hypothetical protein